MLDLVDDRSHALETDFHDISVLEPELRWHPSGAL